MIFAAEAAARFGMFASRDAVMSESWHWWTVLEASALEETQNVVLHQGTHGYETGVHLCVLASERRRSCFWYSACPFRAASPLL